MSSNPGSYDTKELAARLAEVANAGTDTVHPVKLVGLLSAASAELARLDGLINNPHTAQFLEAVKLEAAHQRERWGTSHDAGKTDEDWIFLVGHLGGKASQCGKTAKQFDDPRVRGYHLKQRLHHIITAAAALLNWHANATGASTSMRPGIAPPEGM